MPIAFRENSELLPVTRQKIVKIRETLKREKLTPWLWFNSLGVKVMKFDGGIISMRGVQYEGSQALVFWQFIVPFLEDAIVHNLDETLETCRARGLKPEEPYIRESAMLLDGHLVDPVYRYMAYIDQHIRGKGDPKSVRREDVTDRITEMVQYVAKCRDEIIQGIRASGKPLGKDGQGKRTSTGDKARDRRERITLQQFFEDHCDLSKRPDIDSKREMLLREYRAGRIKLPLVGKKKDYRKGQTYLFWLDKLLDNWTTYRKTLTTLPPLKKSGNK